MNSKLILFVLFSILTLGNALRCTTCGDDGVCKPGVEEKNVECKADQLSCFISLTKLENGSFVDVKGCLDQGAPQVTELRGCVHITGKENLDGEYCFCDFDECNAHRCNTDFCSCGFSDPMHCRNITEGSYIQCRTCEGPSCENGENADLKKCDHGEGSCFYGRVQTPDRHEVEIMRGCGDAFHGAKLEGCFDLKGFAGSDFTMDGQFCFCDKDDCNKQSCDPTNCDCVYADQNSCNGGTPTTLDTPTTTSSSGSILQTSIILCIFSILMMF